MATGVEDSRAARRVGLTRQLITPYLLAADTGVRPPRPVVAPLGEASPNEWRGADRPGPSVGRTLPYWVKPGGSCGSDFTGKPCPLVAVGELPARDGY